MVVIPVQFEGLSFTSTKSMLEARVAEAERYFNDQYGDQDLYSFTLAPIVTVSNNVQYYGANYSDRKDVLLHEAVREACTLSRDNVDFSLYDNDSDSEVDNVFILFAGVSEADGAGASYIWPQYGKLKDNGGTLTINGVQINSFATCTELSSDRGTNPRPSGIGTFCHEFAHHLGLPDLYDTDLNGSGGLSKGLWDTGLMDTGFRKQDGYFPPNFSAVDLDILGTGNCMLLTKGEFTLNPIDVDRTYLKLPNPDDKEEYFLLECRRAQGWDSLIGGNGLIVYHIDKSGNMAGYSDYFQSEVSAAKRWENNQINCAPGYECAYPVVTGTLPDGSQSIFLPCGNTDLFGLDGGASFTFNTGYRSPLVLHNISILSDGSVSFQVIEPIAISGCTAYQDAVLITWATDGAIMGEGSYRVRWSGEGTEGSCELPAGSSSYTIEGLMPQTTYSIDVSLLHDDASYTVNTSISTRYRSDSTYPFIYLESGDGKRNSDGSFRYGAKIPLRLFNVSKDYSVEWYFNGKPVSTGADGYLTLTEAGTLRAEITYADSERMTIIKEIFIQ